MPNDYDDDFDDFSDRLRLAGNEGTASLGVASFVIALVSGIVILGLAVMIGLAIEEAGGQFDEDSPLVMSGICGILMAVGLSVLGIVLGVIGLTGRYRGKIFAGLGLGINTLIFLGAGCLLFIGAIAG